MGPPEGKSHGPNPKSQPGLRLRLRRGETNPKIQAPICPGQRMGWPVGVWSREGAQGGKAATKSRTLKPRNTPNTRKATSCTCTRNPREIEQLGRTAVQKAQRCLTTDGNGWARNCNR